MGSKSTSLGSTKGTSLNQSLHIAIAFAIAIAPQCSQISPQVAGSNLGLDSDGEGHLDEHILV